MLKNILRWILILLFSVKVKGLNNYKNAGDSVLIISNHRSLLDPLLLAVFLPDTISFAINTQALEHWWYKPFFNFYKLFPLNPTQTLSLRSLVQQLKKGAKTVIYPQGRITKTKTLIKIYDGAGLVADKSSAALLPVSIHYTKNGYLSSLTNILCLRWFPKITITILPHTKIKATPQLKGKSRRKYCAHFLNDIMTDMMFTGSHYQKTLFSALLEARTVYGGSHAIVEDIERQTLSYNSLITRSIAIGNALKNISQENENIGIFLPNSTKTLNIILGLQLYKRVPAMLNYSVGYKGMLSACKTAKIKTVLTSRRFIKLAKFDATATALESQVNLIYLEDFATSISAMDKIKALIQSHTINYWYKNQQSQANSPAVILFTSGSEGAPKGVVLSHANILANHKQLFSRVNFNSHDVILNYLPMFHSFGFSVGTLLPILNGMKTFFYPSPVRYSIIPEIAYEIDATIMFGTNTFLAAYAKQAHAFDFYNMRYVVAGAEKLHDSTRDLWTNKFGIRVLEGYGTTEASPVVSVNTPTDFKPYTVGRLMPSLQYKLQEIPGIENAGQLHLCGPNIMLGYLLADNPGALVPPESMFGKGWYDTGDIVHIDEEEFITIRGRSKRFAKVSGEMVSLAAIEELATQAWPNSLHAATNLYEENKGEQVILLTTEKHASEAQLKSSAEGVNSIYLPKKVFIVDSIPVLATGKTNYPEVAILAQEQLDNNQ